MAVALIRAVAQEGSEVCLRVRQKPTEAPAELRVPWDNIDQDLLEALPTGEVKIEDGVGELLMIDHREGQRNAHLTIRADHLSNHNITGWFDASRPEFQNLARGSRVAYRIIVRRKVNRTTMEPTVDRSIDIGNVPNDQKVRDMTYCGDPAALPPIIPRTQTIPGLVSMSDLERESLPLRHDEVSQYAPREARDVLTRTPGVVAPPPAGPTTAELATPSHCGWCDQPNAFCQCPPANPRPVRQEHPQRPGVCIHTVPLSEQCPHCLGMVQTPPQNNQQRSLPTPTNAATVPNTSVGDGGSSKPPQDFSNPRRPNPRREEAKPWVLVNSDGTLNLGSYAFDGIVECEALAVELCEEHRQQTRQSTSDRDLIRKTTKALMLAADVAQAAVRPDGKADAMDASHKRARYCVRMASKRLAVPFEGRAEDWRLYAHALGEHAAMLLQIAVDLFEEREKVIN